MIEILLLLLLATAWSYIVWHLLLWRIHVSHERRNEMERGAALAAAVATHGQGIDALCAAARDLHRRVDALETPPPRERQESMN